MTHSAGKVAPVGRPGSTLTTALAVAAILVCAHGAFAQVTSSASQPAAASAPAADATSSEAVPPDPTLPKKKRKAAAAATAPAIGDQPPVALETGKKPATTAAAATPSATATGTAAANSTDTATTIPPSTGTAMTAADTADAATADVKKKKKLKHLAAAKPADATTKSGDAAAGTTAATADVTASTTPPGKKNVHKTAAMTDASAPPEPGSKCKVRSFLVNDYGKDGPTADAKRLLDQDITDWSKANNLKNVTVGSKNVSCEQFLNFIVFDEWTCTASAKVCWQ